MARMIPITIEILIWMTNASPIPRTWSGRVAERQDQEVADRHRDEVADDRADADRDERLEQARPQLAEMVDERHDRLVAGRGRGRGDRGGILPRRDAGDARLEQGVGVGHDRVAGRRASWRRWWSSRTRAPMGRWVPIRARRPARRPAAGATGAAGAAGATGAAGAVATGPRRRGAAATGAAAGSGEVSTSTLTDSWRSVEALRNSWMLLPSDAPTSGSLPGPRISSAITRMMMSSGAPMFGICDAPVDDRWYVRSIPSGSRLKERLFGG